MAKLFILIILSFAQAACAKANSTEKPQGTQTKLVPTVYYHPILKIDSNSCDSNKLVDLTNTKNQKVATICKDDIVNCARQGSCTIENQGKNIHIAYETRKKGVTYFEEISLEKCAYGFGVKNICIDPYHSVAADLTIYKTGAVIYLPSVRGTILPTGETHDGYFIVRDTGQAIVGLGRFDFYTGYEHPNDQSNPFGKLKLHDPKMTVDYQLVSDEAIIKQVHNARSFPLVPKMNY